MRKQVRLSDHCLGFGVRDDEFDLLRLEQRVHWPRPRADLEAGEIEYEILGTICEQQTHPITFGYANRKQSGGCPINFIVERAIGEHSIIGFQKQELFFRGMLNLGLQKLANVFRRSSKHARILAKK